MQRHTLLYQLSILTGLLMLSLMAPRLHAQMVSIPGFSSTETPQEDITQAQFQRSLDDVVTLLENDQQRQQLLDSLKELQTASAVSDDEVISRQGLLGALAETLAELGEQANEGGSPREKWAQQLSDGLQDLQQLGSNASPGERFKTVVDGLLLAIVWATLLIVMIAIGRMLAARKGWPQELPRDPRGGLMAIHFLRRMLPWTLSFAIVLGLGQLLPESAGRTAALVVAYICLCGRALSVVFETVIAFFSRGHRYTAVRLLQSRALRRLFVIGALIALGDAVNSHRLMEILGDELSTLVSTFANMLAAVVSTRFIFQFKRPIRHLIRNRPYHLRRDASTAVEIIRALGGLWHIPALLLVGASLLAIFISVGDVETALARSIVSASLLVLTLVITGLLRRQAERVGKHRHRRRTSQYRKRLGRLGFVLGHIVSWMIFAELLLQVWSSSLFGIGRQGLAGSGIAEALLSLGATVLIAWLVWILVDTAIQRALITKAGSRGRRVNQARAQTITPMIRNVLLVTILVIASIVGLANLGVNVTPLLAGAGVIGLAIGFGAQTLVQDLITGIFIVIEDSLAVDDFVQINGHMGTVEGLTLRTVRLRDLDGIVHIITFSRIDSIHNMSRQFGIALLKIRIPYDMKIDSAINLMQETALGLRKDPMMRHYIWSPLEMQGIHGFDEGCPILRMRFKTAPEMQWDVARAFNLLLKQRMDEQEIYLGAPRLSIRMEGHAAAGWQDTASATSSPAGGQPHAPGEPSGEAYASNGHEGGDQ